MNTRTGLLLSAAAIAVAAIMSAPSVPVSAQQTAPAGVNVGDSDDLRRLSGATIAIPRRSGASKIARLLARIHRPAEQVRAAPAHAYDTDVDAIVRAQNAARGLACLA